MRQKWGAIASFDHFAGAERLINLPLIAHLNVCFVVKCRLNRMKHGLCILWGIAFGPSDLNRL